MKIKKTGIVLLTVSLMGLTSCGDKKTSSGENSPDTTKNTKPAATEPVDSAYDEKATEEGNTPAYEARLTIYGKDGDIRSRETRIYNKFDDMLSEETDYSSTEYIYEYSAGGLILKETRIYTFDSYSDLDSVSEEINTYDSHGELITNISTDSNGTISESRYENEYNSDGQIIEAKIYADVDGEEGFIGTYTYEYDENGWLEKMELTHSDDILSGVTTTVFTRDENGNAICEVNTMTNSKSGKTSVMEFRYTYNSQNLPESQTWLTNGELFRTTTYSYDFYE